MALGNLFIIRFLPALLNKFFINKTRRTDNKTRIAIIPTSKKEKGKIESNLPKELGKILKILEEYHSTYVRFLFPTNIKKGRLLVGKSNTIENIYTDWKIIINFYTYQILYNFFNELLNILSILYKNKVDSSRK